MPSLGQLLAAQLGLGVMPQAAAPAGDLALKQIASDEAAAAQRAQEIKEKQFNNRPPLLTSKGRQALYAQPDKGTSSLPSPVANLPSPEAQSSKDAAMKHAPTWEKGMQISSAVRGTGDIALIGKLNALLTAVEGGNPDEAIPASLALQQWWKNSPLSVTKGNTAKVPKPKGKTNVSDSTGD